MNENPFASTEFLLFSNNMVEPNLLSTGFEKTNTPLITNSIKSTFYQSKIPVVYTPICFSGAESFNPDFDLKQLFAQYPDLLAGFIQTRTVRKTTKPELVTLDDNWQVLIEGRTNYRLPLLSEQQWLASMKRDSRSRLNKSFRETQGLELIEASTEQQIFQFHNLYSATAERLSFSSSYTFSLEAWLCLLSNPKWKLLLLRINGNVAAGAVVADLTQGFDYTFIAYDHNVPNISRLLLFYVYRYLGDLNSEHSYLDLGGGIQEGDALALFKQSMGGQAVNFSRYKFAKSDGLTPIRLEELTQAMTQRWPS